MPLLPRESIRYLKEGVHGGFDFAEFEQLGVNPDDVIDFSVSTNPLGIPPGIVKPVTVKELSKYPDSGSTELTRMIAKKTGVSPDNIVIGNGSTELLRLAVQAYLGERDKVLILEPTYGEYRTACEIAGAEILACTALAHDDFRHDIELITEIIRKEKPKAVFLCNPNNPTGYYMSRQELEEIIGASRDSLVVLDEAYLAFVEDKWDSIDLIHKGNLLIVRSMTKDYSLAGLRLGYAMANEEIIRVLKKVSPPWSVNVVAQKAGVAVLSQDEYLSKSRYAVKQGKQYLMKEISGLGFQCVASSANFFLVKTESAAEIRKRLLEKGILVRDCASFGLPEFIRVAPQTKNKNRRLVAAVKELNHE